MRIAALGRSNWTHDSIRALASHGHEICLIGTAEAAPEYPKGVEDFRALSESIGCPFFVNSQVTQDMMERLILDAKADCCISVNWPTIFRSSTIGLFPLGIVNAHAGDLPRFRGNAAPNWAILVGESRVVVTLHRMVAQLDAGPILLQRSLDVDRHVYIGDIYDWLDITIPAMFVSLADRFEQGDLRAIPQPDDPAVALRCFPRTPDDGLVDWALPAEDVARLVRASAEPFAGAFSFLRGRRLRIWRAHAGSYGSPTLGVPGQVIGFDRDAGSVDVLCGTGVLILEEVEVEPGLRVPPTALISSTRARLGVVPEIELMELKQRLTALERGLYGPVSDGR